MCASAFAQDLPERIEFPSGEHATVGFELKTTTHALQGSGRTTDHRLMEFVIPNAEASWSEAERPTIERWSQLSTAERTAFFFEHFGSEGKWRPDPAKAPYLDTNISWHERLGVPHIEVRSTPFDSPKEAFSRMRELRRAVPETVAFHVHVRFPDTLDPAKAEAAADYMRRLSWVIALRRADVSSNHNFVLKAMDNQPINMDELARAKQAFADAQKGAQRDVIERRGVRVTRLIQDGKPVWDVELRGFMKDIPRLETYVQRTAEAFRDGNFGPWAIGSEHPLESSSSRGQIKKRTYGFDRAGAWTPAELQWLAESTAELMQRTGLRSSLSGESLAEGMKLLATADTQAGKKMLLPSSFDWLFMPLEYDPALPEGVQEQVLEAKKSSLRKLLRLAERAVAGEWGRPGEANFEPLAIASRARKVLMDHLKLTYTDAGKTGGLLDWYELSIQKPEEVLERTKRRRQETGKNRAEEWRSRVRPTGEGFGPRSSGKAPTVSVESLSQAYTELERTFATLRAAAAVEAPEVARVTLGFEPSPEVDARYDSLSRKVTVTSGLLAVLIDRAASVAPEGREAFVKRVSALILAHELAHARGVSAERAADLAAIELLGKTSLFATPLTQSDLRAALEAFQPGEGTSLIERVRAFFRYGTFNARLRALERAANGGPDPLASFRRANGTVRWPELMASKTLPEVGGLAHFTLALFLKELATVVETGNRLHMEEFFDALGTSDFYLHYGMFALGARGGQLAYGRFLQRYVRRPFLNELARQNVALAAGLLLPQLFTGEGSAHQFAVSLTALGLSSSAVRTGAQGIKWLRGLKAGEGAAATVARSSRWAKLGGFVYTVGETVVVLYAAEKLEGVYWDWQDARAARESMRDAGLAFFRAAGSDPTPEALTEALATYRAAWNDYRTYLSLPLFKQDALFHRRVEAYGEDAQQLEDALRARLESIGRRPLLKARVVADHGSVAAYAEQALADSRAELNGRIERAFEAHFNARTELAAELSEAPRRAALYLPQGAALLPAALPGGNPAQLRILSRELEALSSSRPQTFEDEARALKLAAELAAGDARAALERAANAVDEARQADAALDAAGQLTPGIKGEVERAR
ncbi:MAG: hypothetical protein KDD82_17960 [Planctomycetes bacterium]|nr:hypothetical protein [Planctomycetota bacterium]